MSKENLTLGCFHLLGEVSSGDHGTVYKAVCEKEGFDGVPVGTVVALKVLTAQGGDTSWSTEFRSRVDGLKPLSHPGIARCFGCFLESGSFCDMHVLAAEWLEGETLRDRLSRNPEGLDADEVLRTGEQVLSALAYVSSVGIVHRNIKPESIFLCKDGTVKLVDFELSQAGDRANGPEAGECGAFSYLAPDFLDPTFHGDEQSDIFSFGVCLHEMLTGRLPFPSLGKGRDLLDWIVRWPRGDEDADPMKISRNVARVLLGATDVLAKALRRKREERFGTFAEFAAAFKGMKCRELSHDGTTWQLLKLVGRGGFSDVFKARDVKTGQVVAIKHLYHGIFESERRERFWRETKIVSEMDDFGIVQIFASFEIMNHFGCGTVFLVMEYLDGMPGQTLRDELKRADGKPLQRSVVLKAFARYAHGLAALHAKNLVCRDIRPSKLYFPMHAPEKAAVMDCNLEFCVLCDGELADPFRGKMLDYLPPEVVRSGARVDDGMDIYALGLSLYEALTGKMAYPRLPTGTSGMMAFLERARNKTRPNLDESSYSDLPDLVRLVREMTEPDVTKRLKDAAEVERRLRALLPLEAATDDPGVDAPEPQTLYAAPPYEELEKSSRRRHWLRLTIRNMWKWTFAAVARLLFSGRKQHAEVAPMSSSTCEGEIAPTHEDSRTITLTGSESYGLQDETCRESDDLVSEAEDGTDDPSAFLNLHGHATIHGFRLDPSPLVAEGGQGRVFKAECVEEGRLGLHKGEVVALKFIEETPSSPSFEKFQQAVAYLRELKSSHVPRYYGCFEVERVVNGKMKRFRMTVMEYLDGADLSYRVKVRSPMFYADEIMYVIDQLLEGLCELAEAGIVHRDIKPSNVFICRDGTVKLIDFDMALIRGIDLCPKNRKIVGTPEFAAPDYLTEGFRGDEISDVFSVGMVLYYMEHGVSPHRAKRRLEGRMGIEDFCIFWHNRLLRHDERWHETLADRMPNEQPLLGLPRLLNRSLSVDRKHRYGGFREFRLSLQKAGFRTVQYGGQLLRVISGLLGEAGRGPLFEYGCGRDAEGKIDEIPLKTLREVGVWWHLETSAWRKLRAMMRQSFCKTEMYDSSSMAEMRKSFDRIKSLDEWHKEIEEVIEWEMHT